MQISKCVEPEGFYRKAASKAVTGEPPMIREKNGTLIDPLIFYQFMNLA